MITYTDFYNSDFVTKFKVKTSVDNNNWIDTDLTDLTNSNS